MNYLILVYGLPRITPSIDPGTVLFIHGGSLVEGYDRMTPEYARVCEPFVEAGVGCATMDYRVAPAHRWPAMPQDVASAVRWLKDNLASRGGNPERLFLFGHSSGCQLAAVVGANATYLDGVGLTPADVAGLVPMGCILAATVPILRRAHAAGFGLDAVRARWNGRPDDRYPSFEHWLDSDPSRFVGEHVPPALVVVARAERFHPPILEQASYFVGLMYDAKRAADIVIVPGGHMSSIADIVHTGDPTFAAILAFIEDPGAAGAGGRGW